MYKFTEALSLSVDCKSQEEVDRYWTKLTADGGQEGPCGWLKDKFGLSWQITPALLGQMLSDTDRKKSRARDGGDDEDEEDRHRRAQAGLRGMS